MLTTARQFGFSIIELLVGIVIVGILLSVASTSYDGWIQNQQIRTATDSILNGLQVARSEAVKNNTNVRFILCGVVNPNPNSSWDILAITTLPASAPAASPSCPGAAPQPAANEVRVQDRNAGEGSSRALVTVTPLAVGGAVNTITFNGLGRVVPNADLSVTLTRVDVCLRLPCPIVGAKPADREKEHPLAITQGAGGSVRMCDPAANITDPRRC